MAAAQQQMEAMGQELDQLHGMLQNVSKSMEAQDMAIKEQEANIKAYDAETKRISAVQASMSADQIQDIVMGTVNGMLDSGDLVGEMSGRGMPNEMAEQPQGEMPMAPQEQPMMPPEGMQQ